MLPMPSSDTLLGSLDHALRTVAGAAWSSRPNPADAVVDTNDVVLTDAERRTSGALMRVNHVGEVCAQALYQAQALTARTPELRRRMADAAREETDHLAWTQSRLHELGDRPSLLNPLWYAGSFAIGLAAGAMGDRTSLAFVVETENQVEQHLAGHLDRLPAHDTRSRAVVEQMKADEAKHAQWANDAGARQLPAPLRAMMKVAARVMTSTAHRL
jgi:3-demethoxyubiquinol 3-hydroxylase